MRQRFRFIAQLESIDCGPACLAMIARFYGLRTGLREIKRMCEITRMGISVQDVVNGGRKLGFDCVAAKVPFNQLAEVPLPAILFWKQEHYVVLHRIVRHKDVVMYHLADPAHGLMQVEEEGLLTDWIGNAIAGVVIMLQPPEDQEWAQSKLKSDPRKASGGIWQGAKTFVAQHKGVYVGAFALLVFGLVANWFFPLLFRRLVDDGLVARSMPVVAAIIAAQFLLFASSAAADLWSDFLITRLNLKLSLRWKNSFLLKLFRLPISYFDARMNTDTLHRLDDQRKLQSFATWKGISGAVNGLNLVVFSVLLCTLNVAMFGVFLLFSVASILWAARYLRRRAMIEYGLFLRQSQNSNLLYESIMHMPEIKVFSAQQNMIEKANALQEQLNAFELRSLYLNMYQISGVNLFTKLKELSVLALGAWFIMNNRMTVGTLLSASYILGQLNGPLSEMTNALRDWQDARIAAERVGEVLEEQEEAKNTLPAPVNYAQNLSLAGLSFRYPGSWNKPVLNEVNIQLPVRKVTAVVGASGSGKTTLLKLLLGYYQPQSGSLMLGEIPLSTIDIEQWRLACGAVLQDGHIFSGTIAQNIALADKEPDLNRVENALKVASLDEFVSTLPMGVHTKLGQTGTTLSGGQSQRLLIARAVYKNPEWLFLDEATSSLDARNEAIIISNLRTFFSARSVVVVAHRLSTVKDADNIIVLKEGQVVEQGTHQELVELNGVYVSLIKNQLELGL